MRDYKKSEAWSQFLANSFGELAVASFVIGSDIFWDNLQQDVQELSSMPKGSHLGEIGTSWLESDLPPQFLMWYDYDFLYILRATITHFQTMATMGNRIIAHSVINELVLYLIMEESRVFMDSIDSNMEPDDMDSYGNWDNWAFGIFDDMDIVSFLYSNQYLDASPPYHFEHWQDAQFYCEEHDPNKSIQ